MVQSGAYEVDLRESFLREGLQEVTTAELIQGWLLHLSGGATTASTCPACSQSLVSCCSSAMSHRMSPVFRPTGK